jgi:hypothetical protein
MTRPRLFANNMLQRLAAGALALVLGFTHTAVEAQATEAEIKAAYVFNFAKFVEWPEGTRPSNQPFVVCHVRLAPAFLTALGALEKRVLDGQTLVLRALVGDDSPRGCHILVLDENDRNPIRWVERVGTQPTLTIGEGEAFARDGGAIGFVAGDSRIQFAVNTDSLARAQLKAKAQLLRVATLVKDRR